MPDYRDWNQAIGEWFFNPQMANKTVVFAVDSEALRHSMGQFQQREAFFGTDEEAKGDFLRAIRSQMKACEGRWLRDCNTSLYKNKYPPFIGWLAAQVLAVFEIGGDASTVEQSQRAYWPTLDSLLASDDYRLNKVYSEHQELWRDCFEYWANILQKGSWGRLRLPDDDRQGLRHVRLPFSQALLRSLDILRLSSFFREARFRPRQDVSLKQLTSQVARLIEYPAYFSTHAQRTLRDPDRTTFALQQIVDALALWDGTETSLRSKRLTTPRHTVLSISTGPSRHLGELTIRLGDRVDHHAGSPPRLTPAQIVHLLHDGQLNSIAIGGKTYLPARGNSQHLLAVCDSLENKYIERSTACPGDRIHLLIRWRHHTDWTNRIQTVAEHGQWKLWISSERARDCNSPEEQHLTNLPPYWCILSLKVSRTLSVFPAPWSSLIDRKRIRFRTEGGLRLGRRRVWLAGAGPRIRVEGEAIPDFIIVDGTDCQVHDGIVATPILDRPGDHEVRSPSASIADDEPVVRIRIRHPSYLGSQPFSCKWLQTPNAWPQFVDDATSSTMTGSRHIAGMWITGKWDSAFCDDASRCAQQAVLLLLHNSIKFDFPISSQASDHPLMRSLRLLRSPNTTQQHKHL